MTVAQVEVNKAVEKAKDPGKPRKLSNIKDLGPAFANLRGKKP